MTAKRSHRQERLARIYDEQILPIWSHRFGRMLLRDLDLPDRGTVLDVACGTGYPALEILRKLGEGGRVIAIDASSALLDVARKKAEDMGRKGIYFRTESAVPRLSFAADVYDLVVCNLGLSEMPDPAGAVADFTRVAKPGGQVRCSLPLAGTFQEFYDIYREVLVKHDKQEILERLHAHLHRYPSAEECEAWMNQAGLVDVRVDIEEFALLFRSSREFFFAPVIEYGPLPAWKALAGKGQELQDVFWYIKEAIDAYFGGRAFQLTVKAGCLVGSKPEPTDYDATGRRPRFGDDEIAAAPSSAGDELPEELSEEIEVGTSEIDIVDEAPTLDGWDEVEIDALVEGRQRPEHLDDD